MCWIDIIFLAALKAVGLLKGRFESSGQIPARDAGHGSRRASVTQAGGVEKTVVINPTRR